LIKPKAAAAAAAAATASSAGTPAAAAGGTEQELAQQSAEQGQDMLPAGMNEDGVIETCRRMTPGWQMSRHSGICSGVKRSISTTATATMSRMMSRLGELLMMSIGSVKSAGSAGNYYTERIITTSSGAWTNAGRVRAEALGIEGKPWIRRCLRNC
jgi:hypothetical protein